MLKRALISGSDRLRKALGRQTAILIRNSSWVFGASAVQTLLLFARSIILARTLGAVSYGNYALVVAFVGTLQEFFNLNIGTAIIKFGADYRSDDRTDKLVALVKLGFLVSVVFGLLSIGAIFAASHFFYDVFIDTPGLEPFLLWYGVAGCTAFFVYIATSLLRLYYRFRVNSLVQIVVAVADLAFISVAVYLYPGDLGRVLVAVMLAMVLNGVIVSAAAFWEIRAEFRPHLRAGIGVLRDDWRGIAGFVVKNSGSRTLSTLVDKGDVLVLGAFAGPSQAGFYAIAKKLAFSLNRAIYPLTNAVYPQIARLLADRRITELRALLARTTTIVAVPALLFLIGGLLLGGPAIRTLYGVEYGPAVPPFLVHLITVMVGGVFFWALSFILSAGRVNLRLIMNGIALAAGCVSAYYLTPALGAVGVAIALLLARSIPTLTFVGVATRSLTSNRMPYSELEPSR